MAVNKNRPKSAMLFFGCLLLWLGTFAATADFAAVEPGAGSAIGLVVAGLGAIAAIVIGRATTPGAVPARAADSAQAHTETLHTETLHTETLDQTETPSTEEPTWVWSDES